MFDKLVRIYGNNTKVDDGSLGPLLFLIYINDLEDGIVSNIIKFADDTNVFRREQTRQECRILQDDLNRLVSGLQSGRCYSTKVSVNVFTLDERM